MEETLLKALEEVDPEVSAEYMAETLMDYNNTTWKMYETLVHDWLNGNENYKKGLNDAVIIITGWSLETIAKHLLNEQD